MCFPQSPNSNTIETIQRGENLLDSRYHGFSKVKAGHLMYGD